MKVTTDACLFGGSLPPAPFQEEGVCSLLDIGTGTGLLALMYAQKDPTAKIDAIEIDKETAEQAKENIEASPWVNRINIINADARNFQFQNKYDLIISNPPFYESELRSSDAQKNIAQHGEELLFKELLNIIKANLKPDGLFYLLLPNKRITEALFLIEKNKLNVTHMTMVRQSVNHNVFRIIVCGKHSYNDNSDYKKDEIAIWDERQQYTANFKELLKDYYLHL